MWQFFAKNVANVFLKYFFIFFISSKTPHRQLLCQFQFPDNYPEIPILMELKSKVFPVKVTKLLNDRCDEEAKKIVGRAQVWIIENKSKSQVG